MSPPRGYPRAGNRQGTLILELLGSRLTANVNVPQVRIDGEHRPVSYGENSWNLRAGPHRVDVRMWHRVTYGRASYHVDVAPDAITRLYYSPPHHQLAPAGLGPSPQPRAGGLGVVAYLVVALGLLILLAVIVLG